MAATPAHAPSALRRVPRETLIVLGISGALFGVGMLLILPFVNRTPFFPGPTIPWWALTILFILVETSVVHLQSRREAHTISLSEIALVLGLFLSTPPAVAGAWAVATAVAGIFHRRSPALKTTFNVALTVAEAGIAIGVFAVLTTGTGNAGPVAWLAALVAAYVSSAVGTVFLDTVIALYEGELRVRTLIRNAILGQKATPVAVCVGLVAVTSLSASPWSAWLLIALGVLVLLAYRAYGALSDRHLQLERLYRFSQAVSSIADLDTVMSNVLSEARHLLRAERASAAFIGTDGAIIARVSMDAAGAMVRSQEPASEEDGWLLRQVVGAATPVLLPRTSRGRARRWLNSYGMRDAIAVPMRGSTGALGVLVVADRLGDVRSFEASDLILLETVANHAGVALQNGELIDKLRHEALHDALTGLPNRVDLQHRLTAALDDVVAQRSAGTAVMILDLDDFKEVNDTLGHQQGDALLTEVSNRLTRAVGQGGTVARLGGDEFAILVVGTADEDRVLHIGRRVLRALEQPIALGGLEVEVGGSVGIALAPAHATDPAALLKRADMAMYDAKTSVRRLRLFDAELDSDNPRRLTLVAELRTALHNGDVVVRVQPQTRLDSGEIVGVEALARWRHPTLGDVSPDEFIPIAERSGLIAPLTTHVLDASLAAWAQWRAAGHDLTVAVNLSARSLHDADLVDEVARLLRRHGVPAARLTLEVTESAVMTDPARAVALLHRLRDLGVRLSVDDFGTGYSSLSYLKRLPVHEVKIDRSFVTSLGSDAEDLPIVRAIVDLGRHMGLAVVAEGVEDAETLALLADIGCDLAQGWHLSRPMPIGHLVPWLHARPQTPGRTRGPLRLV
jgi:diguanylate cyclase (GGDEF)-like protein